jgi:glycerate dehydrogenase
MSLLHHSAAARSTRAFRRYFSAFTASKQQQRQRPVALFLNCSRLDYDRKLDFTSLQTMTDFRRNDQDYVIRLEDIMTLVDDHQPEIVITKEMHVHAEAVQDFPDSVKLLCEAGTGYNNLPLEACRSREILVCNIPTYSTDAVAHTAITYLMNFSINLLEQQRMLQNGDRSNFTVRDVMLD